MRKAKPSVRKLNQYLGWNARALAHPRVQVLLAEKGDAYRLSLDELMRSCPIDAGVGGKRPTPATDELFVRARNLWGSGIRFVPLVTCEQCGEPGATPFAEQCQACRHEWRGQNPFRAIMDDVRRDVSA